MFDGLVRAEVGRTSYSDVRMADSPEFEHSAKKQSPRKVGSEKSGIQLLVASLPESPGTLDGRHSVSSRGLAPR